MSDGQERLDPGGGWEPASGDAADRVSEMAGEGPDAPPPERNLRLVIEYDGSAYAGFQSQKDLAPTVQGELVKAIERVVGHEVLLRGAGRTDRGVHALGQAANFHTPRKIPERNLLLAINTHLPPDIAVLEVKDVPPEFHARHSALGKHYRYTLFRSRVRSVFASRWSLRVSDPLDLAAMREGAAHLIGHHDFQAFATRSSHPPPTTDRTVYAIAIGESPPYLFIDVLGHGFLYNMVRAIAGTLIEVGRGRRTPLSMREALLARDRRLAGPTAQAQGLCLMEVFYDPENLQAAIARLSGRAPPPAGEPAPPDGPGAVFFPDLALGIRLGPAAGDD